MGMTTAMAMVPAGERPPLLEPLLPVGSVEVDEAELLVRDEVVPIAWVGVLTWVTITVDGA